MKACPFCAESIQDEANFCRFCGRDVRQAAASQASISQPTDVSSETLPTKGSAWPFVVLGLVIGLSVLSIVAYMMVMRPNPAAFSSPPLSPPSSSRPATRATAPAPAGVTLTGFNRLQTGMTYSQVVEILGSSGTEISRLELAGITTVMYQWTRFGGANMNAMFQNGQLVSKAQFGLR